MVKAISNYRQVRVTLTEERDMEHRGAVVVSFRVHVKPQNAEWHDRQLVLSGKESNLNPLETLEDVYGALLQILSAQPLPGHIG